MARSNVRVIGMGDRVTGQNRDTGKPYDFRKVAFEFIPGIFASAPALTPRSR